jgi:hypothetical protein
MNRLERVGETLRAALNSLAVTAPEWLRAVAAPEWFKPYGCRIENFNLPKTEAERTQLSAVIGSDGKSLLQAIALRAASPLRLPRQALTTMRDNCEVGNAFDFDGSSTRKSLHGNCGLCWPVLS